MDVDEVSLYKEVHDQKTNTRSSELPPPPATSAQCHASRCWAYLLRAFQVLAFMPVSQCSTSRTGIQGHTPNEWPQ